MVTDRKSKVLSAKPGYRLRPWFKIMVAIMALAVVTIFVLWAALPLVPLPGKLLSGQDTSIELVDRSGRPLRSVPPGDGPLGQHVSYGEIPLPLIQATLAAEDKRFWEHPGVDWKATVRAAWQYAKNRRVISGASTITQQLIKSAQPRPRTVWNKLFEAVQALRLEQVWSKQRIIAEYLNRVEYGNYTRGCSAAARFYFGKPLADLSTAECALLAGLPQAPTRLNPHKHFTRALKRQRWIIERLHECGWLAQDDYERAKAEEIHLAKPRRSFEAPHFTDLVLEHIAANRKFFSLETKPIGSAGSNQRIRTTLDLELNRFVESALKSQLAILATRNVNNGAVVVLDNRSCEVLAMIGSEDYFDLEAGQVNGAWAPRSAGSTFKPFTYLLALERGATAASIVADVPSEFPTSTGLFVPLNYNRHCSGPVRYRIALANSLNIPAVKVLAAAGGPAALMQKLQACGLTTLNQSPDHYGLGLTIGNAEARLLELANAYACLARLGEYKPFFMVRDFPRGAAGGVRIADRGAAYMIADMLSDNAARAMAFGTASPLRFDFPVACKTGTSSNFRDNWAFGYTPEFTVGVWIGNFDGAPMREVSGISGAGPVLHQVFEHLHTRYGTSWYDPPAEIVEAWVDPLAGKRVDTDHGPAPRAPNAIKERFVQSTLPSFLGSEDYDSVGRLRLGAEYREWLSGSDNWLGNRAVLKENEPSVRILFPQPGTTVYLDPDLPDKGSRLHLSGQGRGPLRWTSASLDLREEGSSPIALLKSGRHELVARDQTTGAEARTWITVLDR